MNTISLWEPWGSAVAYDLKRNETRSWPTKYRGPIAIHTARTTMHAGFIEHESVRDSFHRAGVGRAELTFGAVVAVAHLYACRPAEEIRGKVSEQEKALGDYADGRYIWMLRAVQRLLNPLPWKGKQGWFDIPDRMFVGRLQRCPYLACCPHCQRDGREECHRCRGKHCGQGECGYCCGRSRGTVDCPDCGRPYDGHACVCQCPWLRKEPLTPHEAFNEAMREDDAMRAPEPGVAGLRKFHGLSSQDELPLPIGPTVLRTQPPTE